MKQRMPALLVLTIALGGQTAASQQGQPRAPKDDPSLKTTFVRLQGQANAVLVEPIAPNDRSHIAVLITHPERANNFNYFIGLDLPKYGYRAMMLNYYGKEQTYYEFLQPLAAAIKALRAIHAHLCHAELLRAHLHIVAQPFRPPRGAGSLLVSIWPPIDAHEDMELEI